MSVVKGTRGSDALKVPSLTEELPSIAALRSRSVVGGGQSGTTYVDFLTHFPRLLTGAELETRFGKQTIIV